MTAVAGTVQAFFTERLIGQRRASPHTVAAYRDAIRLLLNFSAERTGAVPCRLDFTDLDAPVISAFLDHIERERGNTIRSRNARLAAIHSLFSFAADFTFTNRSRTTAREERRFGRRAFSLPFRDQY